MLSRGGSGVRAPRLARSIAKKIDGKTIAKQIRSEIQEQVAVVSSGRGFPPGLATVLVGGNEDSKRFVALKHKAAAGCGIETFSTKLAHDSPDLQEELLAVIDKYNEDRTCDGILVQLPLPSHVDSAKVLSHIAPHKDVDGFHPLNVGKLARSGAEFRETGNSFEMKNLPWYVHHLHFLSSLFDCANDSTPMGCMELLDRIGFDIAGKHVLVLGRSNIVGLPVSLMALHRNASVTTVSSHTSAEDVATQAQLADVIIAAVGQPEFVKGEWLKKGAVVIDVGVNYVDAPEKKAGYRVCGDVDFEAASLVASHITPVPGGVGPMTICMLLQNTLANSLATEPQS